MICGGQGKAFEAQVPIPVLVNDAMVSTGHGNKRLDSLGGKG
jgi:hypothetical protein